MKLRILAAVALAALTVLAASPGAAHVAPWALRGVVWAPAPADLADHGLALRLEINGPAVLTGDSGPASVSPALGTQAGDLAALGFDLLVENSASGLGAPRLQLRIDADGDGAFANGVNGDRYVQVYVGTGAGPSCAQGAWASFDLLDDTESNWHVPGLGYAAPSVARAWLDANLAAHQIHRVDLQWDREYAGGPHAGQHNVAWFDNVAVGDHVLAEPSSDAWCPILPDGTGACPFRVA